MSESTFLSEEDVAILTGIGKGAMGLTKHHRQAAQLRKMGVPFWLNAKGRPIVTHAGVNGSRKESRPLTWEPPILT